MQEELMKIAILEAKKCKGDVPIGAVIVCNGKIIAKAHNRKEQKQDATCHAEILAIRKASKKLKNFMLETCEMYVTLEPCMMCYGAICSARIKKLYFGAYNEKYPCVTTFSQLPFNHYPECMGGIREEECKELIQTFFKKVRKEHGRNSYRDKNKSN